MFASAVCAAEFSMQSLASGPAALQAVQPQPNPMIDQQDAGRTAGNAA